MCNAKIGTITLKDLLMEDVEKVDLSHHSMDPDVILLSHAMKELLNALELLYVIRKAADVTKNDYIKHLTNNAGDSVHDAAADIMDIFVNFLQLEGITDDQN